jgi:cytochrome c553
MNRFLFLSLFTISSLFAAESEYVFKAKGEFAEQLKALIEQHAKDGQVTIQKVEPGYGSYANGIVDAFLNDEISSGDIEYGQSLYETRCVSCHGQKADDSKYANARVLKTLSKEELINNLTSYSVDDDFGGSTKAIMVPQAKALTEEMIASISAYIYSIDHKSTPKQSLSTQDTSGDVIIDLDKKSYLK